MFEAGGALERPLLSFQVEGIGVAGGPPNHVAALAQVIERLHGARVVAVGHRVVHGGVRFDSPVLIDDEVEAHIAELQPLAPLHQPHNLAGIRAARTAFPGVPQVACFDTAFHRRMPALNQRFAIPEALHEAGIRRYGFHGLSYESICAQLGDDAQRRVVVAHLGNGASMCGIHQGHSVATTMSFSPLDGLPMGTRSGRIDAAVVLHLVQREGWTPERVERLLVRESGLLGLSGVSSDMRELQASDSPRAALAIDYFVEHAQREVAWLAAALKGLDLLVFTGGIGEHAHAVRARIVRGLAWLGLQLDEDANARPPGRISAAGSAVEVRVVRTDEERVIACHVQALAGLA